VQKVWWANIRWKSIVEISTVLVINFGGVRKSGVHSSKNEQKLDSLFHFTTTDLQGALRLHYTCISNKKIMITKYET